MSCLNYPTLYAYDKTGRLRMWSISVENNVVYKAYGLYDGKKVETSRVYEAKNVGRSNATTAEEQAHLEAKRDWIKQLDKQYFPSEDDEEGVRMMKEVISLKGQSGNVNTGIANKINCESQPLEADDTQPLETPVINNASTSTQRFNNILPNGKLEGYETSFLPMHADEWEDKPAVRKYIDFKKGVYVQPKLNGIRVHARFVNGYVVLTTRQGKQFPHFQTLRKAITPFFQRQTDKGLDIVLDCEFYTHYLYAKAEKKGAKMIYTRSEDYVILEEAFQIITGVCNVSRLQPAPVEDQLQLWVFDIADESGSMTQPERFQLRDELFNDMTEDEKKYLVKVETTYVHSLEEVEKLHDTYASDNYEGVMLRSIDLKYESGKRSKWMRKYKHFEDAEFAIIGVECDPGVSRENFTFVCVTNEGKEFRAKPVGNIAQRQLWYDTADMDIIGKKVATVRYKFGSFISGDVPREPRVLSIRDYE